MKKIIIVILLSVLIASTVFAQSASVKNRDKYCGEYCPICGYPGSFVGFTEQNAIAFRYNLEDQYQSRILKSLFICEHLHLWECWYATVDAQ